MYLLIGCSNAVIRYWCRLHPWSVVVRVIVIHHLVGGVAFRAARIQTHARLPLVHVVLIAHVVAAVGAAWWLVVVRLGEAVQVV